MTIFLVVALLISLYVIYNLIGREKRFKSDFKVRLKTGSTSKMKEDYGRDLNEVSSCLEELILVNKNLALGKNKLDESYRDSLANMSHDLRTPLTSILGYILLLEKNDLEEKEREYLEIIERKSNDLKELIDRFYETSLAEMGTPLKFEKCELYLLISEKVLSYYDDFMEKFGGLELDLEKLIVEIDVTIFKQVLSNLLSNMLKYSLGENKIVLKDKKLYFSNLTNLSDGEHDELFKKSYVVDSSRNNSTGLGLYIVKTRLDSMGVGSKIYVKENIFTIETDFSKLL